MGKVAAKPLGRNRINNKSFAIFMASDIYGWLIKPPYQLKKNKG